MKCVGVLSTDEAQGVLEIGVPMGVIAAAAPAVSPVAAVPERCRMRGKIRKRHCFAPHPRAVKTTVRTVHILEEAALEAGLVRGALSCSETAAKEGAIELLSHPETNLIPEYG